MKQENVKLEKVQKNSIFNLKVKPTEKASKSTLVTKTLFLRCGYAAWKSSLLPYKHMVSIFEYFPEFGWESLPVTDKTLLYFNLGYSVMKTKTYLE